MNQHPASVSTIQPGPGLSLSYGYGTDRGLRRELNEDSYIAADPVFSPPVDNHRSGCLPGSATAESGRSRGQQPRRPGG